VRIVACVLRSGGTYTVADVRKLLGMVRRNLPVFDRFVCLADQNPKHIDGVEWLPLEHKWPGYWSKIELFRPGVFEGAGRVLYIDLDTVIVGDLSDIAMRTESMIGIGDFYRRPPKKNRVAFASGLMLWTANAHTEIYEEFRLKSKTYMTACRYGDQQWIERFVPQAAFWQDVVPGQVVSYKVHCQDGVPHGARVVCFHGKPKPAEVSASWIQEHWSEAVA
jgi:hypothetical protein